MFNWLLVTIWFKENRMPPMNTTPFMRLFVMQSWCRPSLLNSHIHWRYPVKYEMGVDVI